MNYHQKDLKNALSSAYVLGTLSAKARIRYKQLLMEHDDLQENVWLWEQHLNQLGTKLPPIEPDKKVWETIQKRLGFIESNQAEMPRLSWWQKLLSPQFLFINLFLMASLFLLWQNLQKTDLLISEPRIAIVQNDQAQALWSIALQSDGIKVQAMEKLTQYSANDYQLWMIVEQQAAPISLGLLPQNGELLLAKSDVFDQYDIKVLAISLEPLGGSPNGQPTTVLYTTELVQL